MNLIEWKDNHYRDGEFVVLTGSSSGIGYEYLKLLVKK